MNHREQFLRKRLELVEREQHGAVILVRELSRSWLGRMALRWALWRIEREA